MKGYKKCGAIALMFVMVMLFSSCAVHRHPRPHHHHHRHHHHKMVIIAEQATITEQSKDCVTFEEWLAITGLGSYGGTE